MSQVITSVTGNPCAVLSGPSFAQEVAHGYPTAIVAAAASPTLAQIIQREFSSSHLRVYTNDDVTGVELGGALKNVIALSAGVVHGLNLGHNSAAALITRGIAEITRLSVACGAVARRWLAFQALAILSSLAPEISRATVLWASNSARDAIFRDILSGLNGKVAEGIQSTTAALGLAARYGGRDADYRTDGCNPASQQSSERRNSRPDGPSRTRRIAAAVCLAGSDQIRQISLSRN